MKLLDKHDVGARLGMSIGMVDKHLRAGTFPQPVVAADGNKNWTDQQIAEYPHVENRHTLNAEACGERYVAAIIDPALFAYFGDLKWRSNYDTVYWVVDGKPSFLADEVWELVNGAVPPGSAIELRHGSRNYHAENLKLVPINRASGHWHQRHTIRNEIIAHQIWDKFGLASLVSSPGAAVKLSDFYESYSGQCKQAGVRAMSCLQVKRELQQVLPVGRYYGNVNFIGNVSLGSAEPDRKPFRLNGKGRLVIE